ncbi:MAG: lipoyl(octanoyl) transferase LipB [Pseudomonadota bacterium]
MAPTDASPTAPPVKLETSPTPVDYLFALRRMDHLAQAIRGGRETERLWLLEHPHVYTAGTSATPDELLAAGTVPVHRVGRGGRFTYHGPGQRIGYVMLDLKRRKPDVRAFVHDLERWLIDTLARLGVRGERRAGRVGIWVRTDHGEAKIAALGVRVRRWVTFHGVALNVDPDLGRFDGIVPCGLRGFGVTSLAALGHPADMAAVDTALRGAFQDVFGPLMPASPVEFCDAGF